jgi:hypothetical protein
MRIDELETLVTDPRETLEVELKNWLDLRDNGHRATLAKELIALANHGGGHLVLGFDDAGPTPLARPAGYIIDADEVNGVVSRYADPDFHCLLTEIGGHYVISIPGGHKVPIRSKRDGPNKEILTNSYYIRRPGAKSETPQTGLEWDGLLRRCLENREAEMETIIARVVRAMSVKPSEPPLNPVERIKRML